jgi:arylsulfatase A-like enzyme
MKRKPNILVVLVDQMRYHAMEPAGNTQVRTPNMSRLANEGAQFTNAVSNSPVCTPARACLLTGRYPLSHTVLTNNSMLPHGIPSMGTLLKDQGYDTAYIGKWHLAGEAFIGETESNHGRNGYIPPGPDRHGFDFWAVHHCSHNYWNNFYYRDTPDPILIEGWEPDGQTDIAIDYLRTHAKRTEQDKRPFAMVVSWGTPHTPFMAPDAYKDLYDPAAITFRPNVQVTDEMVANAEHRLSPDVSPEQMLRTHTHNYYAAVSNIDANLGRLLDELTLLSLDDETIVVFTSDHGEMLGSHGQWSKVQPWDESACIPMLIRYPGIVPQGEQLDMPFSITDVLPSIFGLAGMPQADFEGLDLSPALRGEAMATPASSFLLWPCSAVTWGKKWSYCADQVRGFPKGFMHCYRGIRTATHTYVRRRNAAWMLYDNMADPYQLNNLIESQGPAAIPPELDRELDNWLARTGDAFGATDDYRKLIDLETGLIRDRSALKRG